MKRAAQVAKYLMIGVAALIGLALVYAAIWWVSLPRYEGKTVLYWFRAWREAPFFWSGGPPSTIPGQRQAGPSREDVELAFVKMGPRAIDFLIAKLKLDYSPKPLPPLVRRYERYLARFELGRQFLVDSAREDWFTADRLLSTLVRLLQARPETLLPVTARVLKAPDPRLRAAVLQQLQRFGPAAAPVVTQIAEALDDPYVYVRLEAAKALGAVGPPAATALEKLKAREQDTHEEVVQAADAARKAIRGGTE